MTGARPPLLGESRAIDELRDFIVGVSLLEDPVLLTGSMGTGKALAAQKIHVVGRTASAPFQEVPGRTLEIGDLETLCMDGHRGVRVPSPCAPVRGTVYVPGAEEITPEAGADLLSLLENTPPTRRPRLLFGSEVGLDADPWQPHLESGLLPRIAGFHQRIPPLRDRVEDIPVLCRYQVWLHTLPDEFEERWARFAADELPELVRYPWPGNVAELIAVVRDRCGGDGGVPLRYRGQEGRETAQGEYLRQQLAAALREFREILAVEECGGGHDVLPLDRDRGRGWQHDG